MLSTRGVKRDGDRNVELLLTEHRRKRCLTQNLNARVLAQLGRFRLTVIHDWGHSLKTADVLGPGTPLQTLISCESLRCPFTPQRCANLRNAHPVVPVRLLLLTGGRRSYSTFVRLGVSSTMAL